MMSRPRPLPRSLVRYGIAIVAVGLAVLLRWLLVWTCGELPPFITFALALCVVAAHTAMGLAGERLSRSGCRLPSVRWLLQATDRPRPWMRRNWAAADIEGSRAAGFDEHLVKPTSPDVLAAATQRVMSHHKLVDSGMRE